LGLLTGALFCFVHGFFVFPFRVVSASYISNLFRILLFYNLLPQFVLYGFFLLLSRDDGAYKLEFFFPLIASFFAVFVPYRILRTPFIPGVYELFVLPLMYALQTAVIAKCLKLIVLAFSEKRENLKNPVLYLCFLVFLFLPQTAEAIRAITPRMLLCGILTSAFFVAAGGFLVYFKFQSNFKINSLRLPR
jgi:hypothetical protein